MPIKCVHQFVYANGDPTKRCGCDYSIVCKDDEYYGCEVPDDFAPDGACRVLVEKD